MNVKKMKRKKSSYIIELWLKSLINNTGAALVECDINIGQWPSVAITIGVKIVNAEGCLQKRVEVKWIKG
jgi:hypothetical protein